MFAPKCRISFPPATSARIRFPFWDFPVLELLFRYRLVLLQIGTVQLASFVLSLLVFMRAQFTNATQATPRNIPGGILCGCHPHVSPKEDTPNGLSRLTRRQSQVMLHKVDRPSRITIDGHAVPSKNAVTPVASTKVPKLMDTDFGFSTSKRRRFGHSLSSARPCSSSLATRRLPPLFSTRVPSKKSPKSSAINKTAENGRHTFDMFCKGGFRKQTKI